MQHFYVLGIETSCDETGIAIYSSTSGMVSNEIFSQIKIHKKFGGIIPEIAAREHIKRLVAILNKAIKKAQISVNCLNCITYTAGPGLAGSLMVGTAFAKSLSYALNVPNIIVNHLEGHMLIAKMEYDKIKYPFLSLIVSGGHTQLVLVYNIDDYKIIADTLDDAVGEVFDKVSRMMNLSYPGGPVISKIAMQATKYIKLTIPVKRKNKLYFSFSGLKTQIKKLYDKSGKTRQEKSNIAYSFEKTIIKSLILKVKLAIKMYKIKQLVVVGGVASNIKLRYALKNDVYLKNTKIFFPQKKYCTDNGAMIAYAGYLKFLNSTQDNSKQIKVYTQWNLDAKL